MKFYMDGPWFSEDETKVIAGAYPGRNHHFYWVIPLEGVTKKEIETGNFNVARTESGSHILTKMVKEDHRAVIFLLLEGGYRGCICPVKEDTTGKLLDSMETSTALESYFAGLYLLNPGERIVLSRKGRRMDDIIMYSFNGNDVIQEIFDRKDYLAKEDIQAGRYQVI